VLLRKTLLLVHGTSFEEMIQEYSHFWTYDLFGKNKFEKKMAFCVSIIKLFIVGGTVSCVTHFLIPFFVKGFLLPHACWIPGNNFVARVILYGLEAVFYAETVFIIVVFDGFYLLMCCNLEIQFALLCKAVRSIQFGPNATTAHEETCWKQLKQYSQYHKFLLK
jgi:hypothetical protein